MMQAWAIWFVTFWSGCQVQQVAPSSGTEVVTTTVVRSHAPVSHAPVIRARVIHAPVIDAPVVRAAGIGRPPHGRSQAQAKLMAHRAAEVVAVRNLTRKVTGHREPTSMASVRSSTCAQLSGYRYVSERWLPDGSVEVIVETPVRCVHSPGASVYEKVTIVENDRTITRITTRPTTKCGTQWTRRTTTRIYRTH